MRDRIAHVTSARRLTQAFWVLIVLLACAARPAHAAPPVEQRRVAEAAHELVDLAVIKPYGMAWIEEHPAEPVPPNAAIVSMDVLATPTIGLALHYAGQVADDPRLTDAARKTARGIASSLDPSGRLPARVLFARSTGNKDPTQPVPDTAPSRAALAFLLALVADGAGDDQATRAARRLVGWLDQQQGDVGSYATPWPPDRSGERVTRIVRLDTTDFRDSALVTMLAADVLDERRIDRMANDAIAFLVGLRLVEGDPLYRGLWGTAYSPSGASRATEVEPAGHAVDLLATRHAMETLLIASVLRGNADAQAALDEAIVNLHRLRRADGTWLRFPARAEPRPSTQPGGPQTEAPETVDLAPLIAAVGEVHRLGAVEASSVLPGRLSMQHRLAVVVAGLEPNVLPTDTAPPVMTDQDETVLSARTREVWRLIQAAADARERGAESAPEQ